MRFRALCIALALIALQPLAAVAADRYALVIGNGSYTNVDPLPNPPNDAKLVSDSLKKVGFEVTLLVNADRRTMDRAAKKLARQLDDAGKNAVGIFYFAGHGVSYEGENWLLPIGSEITQGADIEYETLSANKVLKLLESARNATDILILDACRNNPFRGFSLSGTRAVSRGISRMDAPVGSFIAYSTAPGAVAYDGDGDYSPFAEAFAAEVNTPGNSISDMMIEVRKRVKEKTSKLGPSPQTPWDSSSLTGRFSFVPGASTTPAPVAGPVIPRKDPEPRPGESADAKLWASIESSTDAAEFEYYLKKYPNGQYAELARIRANRLAVKKVDKPTPKPVPVNGGNSGNTGSTGDDSDAARACRAFAGGDAELYRECRDEYNENDDYTMDGPIPGNMSGGNTMPPVGNMPQGGQTAMWYDNEYNQWQVTISGASFVASSFLPGTGQISLSGQIQGTVVNFYILDGNGMQIGYGQGTMTDATHVAYSSYWSNGVFMGSGQFHINHPPN